MVDRCKLPHPIFAVHSHGRDVEVEDMQFLSHLSAYLPDTLQRRPYYVNLYRSGWTCIIFDMQLISHT